MNEYFKNKTILITGASSGIGRSLAGKLAALGANLVLLGRSLKTLDDVKNAFNPVSCLCIAADLENIQCIKDASAQIWSWNNGLDGVAYCAGTGLRARLRATAPELMASRMQINCFAFVELIRQLAMLKKKKTLMQIVAISSLASRGQDKYMTGYAASKAALEAAAKSMAAELLSKNILINLLRCAFVNTPMVVGPTSDPAGDFIDRLEESGYQPLGIIPPEIAADAALYLLGPGALYSSGTTLTINAGAQI